MHRRRKVGSSASAARLKRQTIIIPSGSSSSRTEPSEAPTSCIGCVGAVAWMLGDCGTVGKRADDGVTDLVRRTRSIAAVPEALSGMGCLLAARLRGE